MQDVELVDDDAGEPGTRDRVAPGAAHPTPGTSPGPTPGTSPAVPPPPRLRRRRSLVVGAAVLAVAVGGAAAGQAVVDARERARIARVAAQPGAVDVLTGPATVLWEMPPEGMDGTPVRSADGLLVGVEPAADRPVTAVARDPRTGDVVWQVELLDPPVRTVPDDTAHVYPSSGWCTTSGDPAALVCLVSDGLTVVSDDGELRDLPRTATRLVVLDARDGSVTADLTDAVGHPLPSSFAVVGDLVVTCAAEGDDAHVRAVTPEGDLAWQVTVPGATSGAYVVPLTDLVAVVTPTRALLLDAAGEPVRDVPLEEGRWSARRDALYVLPSIESYERGRTGAPGAATRRTTVVRADGDVELTGDVAYVPVDDGSVPGLVLTTVGNELRAWDGDGDELWSVDLVSPPGEVLVLDGRVHLHTRPTLLTLDARSGAELWRSDELRGGGGLVTDGVHLLGVAASAARGAATELVALAPADGSTVWRSPAPDDTVHVRAYEGLLVAVLTHEGAGREQLVVLG